MSERLAPLIAVARLARSRAPLPASELAMLWAIAARADASGVCWPAVATLGADARICERLARKALKALESRGLIRRSATRVAGRQGTYRLQLSMTAIEQWASAHPAVAAEQTQPASVQEVQSASVQEVQPASVQEVQSESAPGCTPCRSRVHPVPLQGAPRAPERPHEGLQDRPQAPRPRRERHLRRLEESYFAAAFSAGVRDATGAPYVVPRGELRELDDAIDTYAVDAAGAPLADRDGWVRESAAAFRRAVRGRERYHGYGGPRGWLAWLGVGSPDTIGPGPTAARAGSQTGGIAVPCEVF